MCRFISTIYEFSHRTFIWKTQRVKRFFFTWNVIGQVFFIWIELYLNLYNFNSINLLNWDFSFLSGNLKQLSPETNAKIQPWIMNESHLFTRLTAFVLLPIPHCEQFPNNMTGHLVDIEKQSETKQQMFSRCV